MAPSPLDAIDQALQVLTEKGPSTLTIDDLTLADLDAIAWSGEPRHRLAVRDALLRVAGGEVEYLAVRAPGGTPVGKVGIDYVKYPDAGYLWQFATHPALQGKGIGSHLMTGAEARIRSRNLTTARINVEHDNPKARALYERLGFEVIGEEVDAVERADDKGSVRLHRADVTLLQKQLS